MENKNITNLSNEQLTQQINNLQVAISCIAKEIKEIKEKLQ